MIEANWRYSTNETTHLMEIYEGVVALMGLSKFFERINKMDEGSSKLSFLSKVVDSFENFFWTYGVVKKWSMYYIVNDEQYRGLYTETFEVFDEDVIIAYFSESELKNTMLNLDEFSTKYKNDINRLIARGS